MLVTSVFWKTIAQNAYSIAKMDRSIVAISVSIPKYPKIIVVNVEQNVRMDRSVKMVNAR
jgi:hypothetical protein